MVMNIAAMNVNSHFGYEADLVDSKGVNVQRCAKEIKSYGFTSQTLHRKNIS